MIEEDRYVAKDGDLQFPMVVPICGNMSVKNDPISASYSRISSERSRNISSRIYIKEVSFNVKKCNVWPGSFLKKNLYFVCCRALWALDGIILLAKMNFESGPNPDCMTEFIQVCLKHLMSPFDSLSD